MVEQSKWVDITQSNPDHSAWYIKRFSDMAAAGDDLAGEARLAHALAPRSGRILDAGCGPGRVGSFLSDLGHDVVGVDVDPELIAAAKEANSTPTWIIGDLALLDLPAKGVNEAFDVIVCAGNVMTFLAPSTRRLVLGGFAKHLKADGRAIVGFGAGRDYDFDDFFADAESSGLRTDIRLSTWDVRPFDESSEFLVAVLSLAQE